LFSHCDHILEVIDSFANVSHVYSYPVSLIEILVYLLAFLVLKRISRRGDQVNCHEVKTSWKSSKDANLNPWI
jgi:hypothetical protein